MSKRIDRSILGVMVAERVNEFGKLGASSWAGVQQVFGFEGNDCVQARTLYQPVRIHNVPFGSLDNVFDLERLSFGNDTKCCATNRILHLAATVLQSR
jgi:hypothetical protein